jgi:hypothetical protein
VTIASGGHLREASGVWPWAASSGWLHLERYVNKGSSVFGKSLWSTRPLSGPLLSCSYMVVLGPQAPQVIRIQVATLSPQCEHPAWGSE